MPSIGANELVIILIIVVVLFGGRKIPEILRGLGQGLREFKAASREDADDPKKLEASDDTADAKNSAQ